MLSVIDDYILALVTPTNVTNVIFAGLGNGPHVLGNGPHVLDNGPHVLDNGPHVLGNGPS